MAYAESTIGGSSGGYFRVWVNSIRTYDGSPSENYENWRVEGGVNRVSTTGGRAWNLNGNSTYTIQLGINGMAASGNWNYDSTANGAVAAWGSGTTTAYRNSAGVGFGFTSRTDVNMQNSPWLTSGWVQSSDAVQTKYRHASLTALSMDSGVTATDEGPLWLEFSNPAGASVDAFIEAPIGSRIFTSSSGIGSRYNFTFPGTLTSQLQTAIPNSNTGTLRVGIHDALGGDSYDYRARDYSIKNNTGQANPTFSNFTYADTNTTVPSGGTVGVTGDNQYLIQGKSTLDVTISTANKATPNKSATMNTYNVTVGGYSQNSAYSSGSDVVKSVGAVSDVTSVQSLGVRAIDSRGNSKTVTKNVTILPYSSPTFVPSFAAAYTNNYDTDDGLTVIADSNTIANISPLTISSVDKNSVNSTSGVQFDMSKDNNTSYTGTPVNVTISQGSGTGVITSTLATIASTMLTKMTGMTSDNSVRWYVKFKITDALETQYYETYIDVGKPIMRISADGNVYFNEVAHQSYDSITSSSSPAPVGSASLNMLFITALAAAPTFSAPSGTPTNGNRLIIRIKDNGAARLLSWDAIYVGGYIIPPTTTIINKTMYVGFVYNSTTTKWECVLNAGNI